MMTWSSVRFRIFVLILLGVATVLSCQRQERQPGARAQKDKTAAPSGALSSGRAVSLTVLQKTLQDCTSKGTCPDEAVQLVGIRKVLGYVTDARSKDIILFGSIDATSSPLYLEDLVVALRNTWMKYAVLRGNTYHHSPPGCSIDPDPDILRRLDQVADQIRKQPNPEKVQKRLEQWHSQCRQPQQVRVLGIPYDSRFAKVMVEADYYMKRLVDGSVTLDIDGFRSLTDMTLNMVREDIQKGEAVSVAFSSLNRFWFFPGENSFLEDKGVVYIKRSDVRLLTEEEFLNRAGRVVGTGKGNPLAQKFADSFSARYAEIAKAKPIYTELEGLFRFVALARIMKQKEALSESGIGLEYLLDQYPVKNTAVSRSVPGISNIKEFKQKSDIPGGYSMVYLWLPSCGGVNIDIRIKDNDIVRDGSGGLLKTRESVLKARPTPETLSWDFRA